MKKVIRKIPSVMFIDIDKEVPTFSSFKQEVRDSFSSWSDEFETSFTEFPDYYIFRSSLATATIIYNKNNRTYSARIGKIEKKSPKSVRVAMSLAKHELLSLGNK